MKFATMLEGERVRNFRVTALTPLQAQGKLLQVRIRSKNRVYLGNGPFEYILQNQDAEALDTMPWHIVASSDMQRRKVLEVARFLG
jgi:hypothetical protein